jgi:spermidine/putrescine transport system permease protein
VFRSSTGRAYLLLTPAMFTVVVIVGCLGLVLVLSFWTQNYLSLDRHPTLANYQALLSSEIFWRLMLRSARIAAIVTVLSLLLAYPVAYFVAFDLGANKFSWLVLFTLPCWISYLLRILSWKLILGYNGVINAALMHVGLIATPLSFLLYNPTSVTIALTQAWAPFALLPIYVSLEKIDRALILAAGDLGDSPLWSFARVTLPLSLPGIAAAAFLIFIPTFGDYVTPQLVGGPSGPMIGTFVASQFGPSNNWPLGSAASLIAMLGATVVVCLFLAGSNRLVKLLR